MFNKLRDWLVAKLLQDSFKQIEKINWMTKALDICYKQPTIKDIWQKFLDSVEGLLQDAIDEVKTARKWGQL